MNSKVLHSSVPISEYDKLLSENEKQKKQIEYLIEEIKLMQAKMFGPKSEKLPKDDKQLLLFEEPEENVIETGEQEEIAVPSHIRKKRGRKPIPDNLPCSEVMHDIPEEDKICGCGATKKVIGEEVSKQIDIIPAKITVIKHIRPKYACKSCEGVEDANSTVMIAPVPVRFLEKSIATHRLIAHIITSKFVDSLPFYRQEKMFNRIHAEISRTNMCNWTIKAAEKCKPLLDIYKKHVLSGPLINADETTFQVLKEPGRKNTSKSYMWVFRGGPPDKPIVYFKYNPTRQGDVARDFLINYKGYVQTDGYKGYDFIEAMLEIILVGCWAHARRNFYDAAKIKGLKKRKNSSADKALKYIRRIYAIEKELREQELSYDEITKERSLRTKPILDEFKLWLDKKCITVPPKSLLGKAINYTLNQWKKLYRFMEQGFITPDNNLVENAIRPYVVGRKNWLFAGKPEGAEATALFYSLIETAKLNNLEPYHYLKFVFSRIPLVKSEKEWEQLLPSNLDPDVIIKADTWAVY
jgi:transposase